MDVAASAQVSSACLVSSRDVCKLSRSFFCAMDLSSSSLSIVCVDAFTWSNYTSKVGVVWSQKAFTLLYLPFDLAVSGVALSH